MNAHLRVIARLCLLVAVTTNAQVLLAQSIPLLQGELNVFIDSTASYTINVTPTGTVYGKRVDWFPVTSYGGYSVSTAFYGNHVDRSGGPGDGLPVIGYALYKIQYEECRLYVDFRDGDYQTSAYSNYDLFIEYFPSIERFVRTDVTPRRVFNLHDTVGIWENGNKSSGSSRVPVTVRNSYNGGYGGTVVIDQNTCSSPCQTIWSLGNHVIAAPAIQGGAWVFDHWSDGGGQTHTVDVGVAQFANTYTAYYRHELSGPESAGSTLVSYPNPFNPSTWINYSLQHRGHVRLSVVDVLGREVSVPVDEFEEAGPHRVMFDGSGFSSGTYYCRLNERGGLKEIRMLLTK